MNTKTIALLFVVTLLIVILLQNTQIVTVKLFFWEVSMSRIILLPLVLVIGFVAGFIVAKVTGSHWGKK
jgi:uncharacterized integral membrane protein